jgi:hypothetical protein
MRFLADENFNNRILDGLRRFVPDVDILRVQDTEIYQAPDTIVLEWAAKENRIILTRDVHTMIGYAYERVATGLPMPGLIEVPDNLPIGQAIDELAVIIGAGKPGDFDQQVKYIPLR